MTKPAPRIGLALAGGGPLGAIYEVGALCALDEVLVGLQFNRLAGYVGVSAGGFIAAALANGMTAREVCTAFIENDDSAGRDLFRPSLLMRPAWGEYLHRLASLPGLTAQAALLLAFKHRSLLEALERLGRALPSGLLSGAAMERQLARVFSAPGRTNDFRQLQRKLVLVATDLDSGEAVPFGQPGFDDVPISLAVQASAALPGLFAPVAVKGRTCVDGALKKTLHATVLLDAGLDLLICLNPLVPFDATHATRHKRARRRRAAHPAADRRRPAGGAVADLSLADPFAARARAQGLCRRPIRAPTSCCSSPTARPRDVPRQHLQRVAAPRAGRARLSAHARVAALTALVARRTTGAPRRDDRRQRCSTTRRGACWAGNGACMAPARRGR